MLLLLYAIDCKKCSFGQPLAQMFTAVYCILLLIYYSRSAANAAAPTAIVVPTSYIKLFTFFQKEPRLGATLSMLSGFTPFRYEIIYSPRNRHDDFPALGFRTMPENCYLYESVHENR